MDKIGSILFLQSSSDLYGSSRSLMRTISVVKKNFENVHVILPNDGPLRYKLESLGVKVVIQNLGVFRQKYYSFSGVLNRLIRVIKATSFILKYCSRNQIGLVYTNTSVILVGAISSFFSRLKHIQHFREIRPQNSLYKKFTAFIINKGTDYVIFVSNAVKDNWKDQIKDPHQIILHNGIEVINSVSVNDLHKDLNLDSETLIIGMIGRVHPLKGQLYFLDIASSLIHDYQLNAHFVFIGDPYPGYEYLLKEIDAKVVELDISDSVTDLGYFEDPLPLIKSFDCMILPSIEPDSFPTVILESMALRVPVAATNQGGAVEMLANNAGILIPLNDHLTAASEINELLLNEQRLKDLKNNAYHKYQEEFSLKVFQQSMADFFTNKVLK